MAISVKHNKVSTIADDPTASAAGEVLPSDWNAEHTITGLANVASSGAYADLTGKPTIPTVPTLVSAFTNDAGYGAGSVTSVSATAGTGISVTGSPINTSGTLTVTNTAPDQTVVLTAGTGISTSGTYPSFTITNSAPDQTVAITSGTGISVTGTYPNFTVTNSSPNTYSPASVAITGGTIDNTVIGGTTPAAGTFTTITGQTGVLRGTGQNLVVQSQALNDASWVTINSTVTTNSVVAPDGTTTAETITDNATNAGHLIRQSFTGINNASYTFSCYLQKGTSNFSYILIQDGNTNQRYFMADFNLNTGAVRTSGAGSSGTLTSSSITSVGSGWYRCVITGQLSAGTALFAIVGVSDGTTAIGTFGTIPYAGTGSTIYAWGAQLELASTVGTYIPTTTTAVYGTPTLSFSGVAGLGLQSDGSLYVSPAGTGALQAQATTSSTVGGNARGANAVDWQTSRGSAVRVASGSYSVLGGGNSNSATSYAAATVGGESNQNSANYSFIGGGSTQSITGLFSAIVGGASNSATGYYNFIGGGQTNSGTANAAVTTQSGTMNGTIAVTLSGSNASIKVGQYITGTSIAGNTYVAAISGTSLTLSVVASGSSTSTLSFYTPHGVVVGGGNNQATGSYSFIGGGGDAGTAANRNVASGDWSFVGGGTKNGATAIYSSVVGGTNNTASGQASFIGGGGWYGSGISANAASGTSSFVGAGYGNNNSGFCGFIGGGVSNTVNGNFGSIMGGAGGTSRAIVGYHVFPACSTPLTSPSGASQASLLVLARQTTDATATVLTSDTSAASGTNQVILPNNSAYFFRGEVISGVTGGGDTKGWTIEGVIKRGAGVGTTTLVGSTVTSLYADVGAATWTIALAADTTNGGLKVTFTGQAATTIRTVAQIRTTEMTY